MPVTEAGELGFACGSSAGAAAEAAADAAPAFESTEMLGRGGGAAGAGMAVFELLDVGAGVGAAATLGVPAAPVSAFNLGADARTGILLAETLPTRTFPESSARTSSSGANRRAITSPSTPIPRR